MTPGRGIAYAEESEGRRHIRRSTVSTHLKPGACVSYHLIEREAASLGESPGKRASLTASERPGAARVVNQTG